MRNTNIYHTNEKYRYENIKGYNVDPIIAISTLLISAFIPAPIYFGKIFDSQCLLWNEGCDGNGSCLEYDTKKIPFVIFGTCLGFKLLTFLFLLLTMLSYRKCSPKDGEDETSSSTNGNRLPSVSTATSSLPDYNIGQASL